MSPDAVNDHRPLSDRVRPLSLAGIAGNPRALAELRRWGESWARSERPPQYPRGPSGRPPGDREDHRGPGPRPGPGMERGRDERFRRAQPRRDRTDRGSGLAHAHARYRHRIVGVLPLAAHHRSSWTRRTASRAAGPTGSPRDRPRRTSASSSEDGTRPSRPWPRTGPSGDPAAPRRSPDGNRSLRAEGGPRGAGFQRPSGT